MDVQIILYSNIIKRLNHEIRGRTGMVGMFLNENFYVRLVITYLMKYVEDWFVSRTYLSKKSTETTLLRVA